MENFMGMKLKRKDLDDVNDEFSDFSLSSPACKIRRLDAELPSMPESVVSKPVTDQFKPLDVEELPLVPENEERAIVLFKPMNNPQFHLSSNYSVDPNLISSFKNHALLGSYSNTSRPNEGEEPVRNEHNNTEENMCRAVIPWVPSQQLDPRSAAFVSQSEVSEPMDAEEMEAATMEIEDDGASNATECISHSRTNEGVQHQWQQQHCMIPQAPLNTITPIVWYR